MDTYTLRLSPEAAADESMLCTAISKISGKNITASDFTIIKRSIDARSRDIRIQLTVSVYRTGEKAASRRYHFEQLPSSAPEIIIIGAGPAGLFCALRLIALGIRPVILERGKDVRARRRDLAVLNKEGTVNPDSNYCFGEGGAGTYSDGKLYTRSNKRGSISGILDLFIQFGADERIRSDAHPHIGTNKLPGIITAMREQIEACGGAIFFDTKVVDIDATDGKIRAVITADGARRSAEGYVLATGHSARDIFELLVEKKITIEAKTLALGVRVEHKQSLIDSIQYKCGAERSEFLPPAAYSLVKQVQQRGIFSFCMCPGGIIAPAATDPGELVINGWSPSKRNNPFANSGLVVEATLQDVSAVMKKESVAASDPLLFMKFQQLIERKAFDAGGGNFQAPAQRLIDFTRKKLSKDLPENSYLPGLTPASLDAVFPAFITETLREGMVAFGKQMKGWLTNDALAAAPESRTSSPVRIPRDEISLAHGEIQNLFPCGEGAGYAGGIVSAAMDGERVAGAVAKLVYR